MVHGNEKLFWDYGSWSTTAEKSYIQSSNQESYNIEVPMIGITKEELSVYVENNILFVSAKPKTKKNFAREAKYSWYLNEDADASNINAKLENGLLMLSVARIKPIKKSVNIQIN